LNWCYSQPRWSTGTVHSCIVKLPKVDTFQLNAPIVFDPARNSKYPVTIVVDGGGANIVTTVQNGITQLFASTNLTYKYANTSFSSRRSLASSHLTSPLQVQLNSGFEIANCTVIAFGDPTRLGGAVHVEKLGFFSTSNVVFKGNYANRGGAMYIANVAVVSIDRTKMESNVATTSGGGLFIANATTVRISSSSFAKNTATDVGAGAAVDNALYVSIERSQFTLNTAGPYGGGLSLNNIHGATTSSRIVNSTFTSNQAEYGSMVAMGKCSRIAFSGIEGQKNTASKGCGIFWLHASGMPAPLGLSTSNRSVSSNVFAFNVAPYGPNIGTEALSMVAQPQLVNIVDYVNLNQIAASAYAQDYYGQLVNDDTSTATVALTKDKTGQAIVSCRFNNLIAGVFGNVAGQFAGGVAKFSFLPICIPGGSFNITYTLLVSTLVELFPAYNGIPLALTLNVPTKTLTVAAYVKFRNCLVGEKYDFFTINKDTCSVCVDSYSMTDNSDLKVITCLPCPPAAKKCYSNQIILYPGTWRWNNLATTIFTCQFTSYGCTGGNSSGQASCHKGYMGPICGICEPGYFQSSDGTRCDPCATTSYFSPSLIAMILGLILGLLYAFYSIRKYAKKMNMTVVDAIFFLVKGEDDDSRHITREERIAKKQRRSLISRAKIFIATYQVIASTPSTFHINFGPLFTSFVSASKVVNFDFVSYVPISCFQTFHFVEGMITGSLIPLVIVGFCFVVCNLQVWSKVGLEPDRMKRRKTMGRTISRYMLLSVALISFVLTSVTGKLFAMFICVDVDPNHEAGDGKLHRFLQADAAVDCNSEEYNRGLYWAYIMIGLYPIAVPLLFSFLLIINRQEIYGKGLRSRSLNILDEAVGKATDAERNTEIRKGLILQDKFDKMNIAAGGLVEGLGFLYEQYEPEYYLWEVVEIARKISLTSILSIVSPGTTIQCTASILLAIVYVKLYSTFEPFVENNDNVFAEVGQYQIFVTYFAVLVIKQQSLGDPKVYGALYNIVDAILVALNLSMVVVLITISLSDYIEQQRAMEFIRNEEAARLGGAKISTVKESGDTSGRQVQEILAALKRHPDVLNQLSLRLKSTTDHSRRRNVFLDNVDLLELQLHMRMRSKSAARRKAVVLDPEQLARARVKHQPRRRGIMHMDGRTKQFLQSYLRSDEYFDTRHNNSSSSSSSSSSSEDSSASSDDEVVKRTAAELRPSRPVDTSEEGSSISSYESPSSHSSNPDLVPVRRDRRKLIKKKRAPRAASASSTGSDTASESSASSDGVHFGQPEAANYSEASTDDDDEGNNANSRVHPLIAELEQGEDVEDEIAEHYIEGQQVEQEEEDDEDWD